MIHNMLRPLASASLAREALRYYDYLFISTLTTYRAVIWYLDRFKYFAGYITRAKRDDRVQFAKPDREARAHDICLGS